MKKLLFVTSVLIAINPVPAADAPPPSFPNERIGVPPLSLAEDIARRAGRARMPRVGTVSPTTPDPESKVAPDLLPRILPAPAPEIPRAPAPRVSRNSGMPIIEPRQDIDYKIVVVTPNPAIDFRLRVIDPAPTPQPASK